VRSDGIRLCGPVHSLLSSLTGHYWIIWPITSPVIDFAVGGGETESVVLPPVNGPHSCPPSSHFRSRTHSSLAFLGRPAWAKPLGDYGKTRNLSQGKTPTRCFSISTQGQGPPVVSENGKEAVVGFYEGILRRKGVLTGHRLSADTSNARGVLLTSITKSAMLSQRLGRAEIAQFSFPI